MAELFRFIAIILFGRVDKPDPDRYKVKTTAWEDLGSWYKYK